MTELVGDLHAYGMLIVAAIALVILARAPRAGHPGGGRILAGLAAGTAVAFLLARRAHHAECTLGEPLFQWVVPSIGVAVCVTLVRPPARRVLGAIWIALVGFWGTTSYLEVMHSDAWLGRPETRLLAPGLVEYAGEAIARAGAGDAARYPAGFLVRSPLRDAHAEALDQVPFTAVRVTGIPRWHSPVTRLYWARHEPVGVWFPGGTIAEGAPRLEVRELPPELIRWKRVRKKSGEPVLIGVDR